MYSSGLTYDSGPWLQQLPQLVVAAAVAFGLDAELAAAEYVAVEPAVAVAD